MNPIQRLSNKYRSRLASIKSIRVIRQREVDRDETELMRLKLLMKPPTRSFVLEVAIVFAIVAGFMVTTESYSAWITVSNRIAVEQKNSLERDRAIQDRIKILIYKVDDLLEKQNERLSNDSKNGN